MDDPKKLKRQKIIEIAAKEFAEKGYDAANINEIAALSGIGKGSIYLYFKTKKELFLATMETVVEKFNETSDAIMSLDCSIMDKLKLCLESLIIFDDDYIPFVILWSRYQFQNHPDFQDEVFEIFKDLRQPFCELLKEGAEQGIFKTPFPEVTGYLILSMVCMLIPSLQPKNLIFDLPVEKKIEFLINFVLNGLGCNNKN
ncbi:MAG: TetR/AcrR family transcriptional regulator [Bacillales bacterium]|nr:TetR/AcrR family transcriptional regulator [Bacillales bacterium]